MNFQESTAEYRPIRGWLVWSLGVPVTVFLTMVTVMSLPPNTHGIDIEAGSKTFTSDCRPCHFDRVGMPAHHGPNLHDIGKTAGSRKPDQSAAEYILESILNPAAFIAPGGKPGMPRNFAERLSSTEIRNLVGFLATHQARPDYLEISQLDIPDTRQSSTEPIDLRLTEVQLAETVLRDKGQCLNCHALYAAPENQSFAPSLFAAGLKDEEHIRASILFPHKDVLPKYQVVNVLLQDGRIISGQLVSRSPDQVVLLTRDSQQRIVNSILPLSEIEDENGEPIIRPVNTSLMPEGYSQLLTTEEIDAVVKLIKLLN
ncbi:MAG: c-type cytochrome [Planctomycetales bacterium]|nr:c-type cytochrome [Planctomycetales bacterium]